MRGSATPRRETALCLALSASMHLAALAAFAMVAPGGEPSGGSGGAIAVTLVGSDAALAALTEAWAPPGDGARSGAAEPPDPAAAPDPVAPPDTAPTPIAIATAAAPAPRRSDPVTPPATAKSASRPLADAPRLPPVSPRKDAEPATVPQPPRPRPADLRPAPRATAAAPARSAPQAEARQTSRAAGTGGAQEAGPQGSAEVSTAAARARAGAMTIWGAQIQRALQRGLPVPRGMARATRDVRLVLALSVAPNGSLRGAEVLRSSGDPALDAAALRSLKQIGRLPRAPREMTDPAYAFTAPIDLRAP